MNFAQQNHGGSDNSLSTSKMMESTRHILDSCPADAYILVNQPGLHASDFDHHEDIAPHLASLVDDAASVHEAPNVYYDDSNDEYLSEIKEFLMEKCSAKLLDVDPTTGAFDTYVDTTPRVITMDFKSAGDKDSKDRKDQLRKHDDYLYSLVSLLPSPNYVLIYTSTPHAFTGTGDKSDAVINTAESNKNSSSGDNKLPGDSLFENYQFFSPGIFMSIIVSIFLLIVLSQAVTWISQLQVSYKSFEGKRENTSSKQQ